ncbi:uncharacterized protein A4U43_C01F2400 [Asparagus officinalis]|uniref:MYB transcription factor n=1 Tax=Asparagus officinalis TaxID=4686 RepID=A0A1L5JHR2_ASPOF|nr:transcription factor MYB35 [Asparagus officinalis]APO14218.1 MYB transcription factor [Asparagus officinalis]ONK79051.1 uncharacterized protein A4U43_C01F2400 [Asparagus officinalis]BAX09272.1 MYB transcription factor [Asparagus officinalis]
MGRPPCCDKSNVKKGLWTEEEDLKLIAYTNTHGIGNWTSVPKKAGLKRCGKSCRLRWTNYLRPNLKHESFTQQEEEMIITLHATIGSRWSVIAHHLPGRTDNDIKNHWNTKLSKKLCQQGIDPVTHKPISQIKETITTLAAAAAANHHLLIHPPPFNTRVNSCLSRDLKNVLLSKPQQFYEPTTATSTTLDEVYKQDKEIKWSDYLVDDVFVPNQEKELVVNGYGKEKVTSAVDEEVSSTVFGGEGSSSSSSFVEGILDQGREMMMEFPEFFYDLL